MAAIALWLLLGIGQYGLYEPHEVQYAGGAREMLQHGDWTTAYLNGAPELNKPPLFYWLNAFSFCVLEKSGLPIEFVARLPLALMSLCGVFLAWHWARKLWGTLAARCAALLLATAPGWFLFSHQLLIDELLGVLLLTSLYLLWRALEDDRLWRWLLFYAVIGLAVLAKGLPGAFFPLATLGIFILVRRDWTLIARARPVQGLCVVALIVAPWAYLLEVRNPGALRYLLVNEHLKRIMDTREPRDYAVVQVSALQFLGFALLWFAPWSLFVPWVAKWCSPAFARAATPRDAKQDAVLLLSVGALLPVLCFLPVPARLLYYSIPTLPPLLLLSAGWLCSGAWSERWRGAILKLLIAGGALVLAAASFAPGLIAAVDAGGTVLPLKAELPYAISALGAGLLLTGALLAWRRQFAAFVALILTIACLECYSVHAFSKLDDVFSSRRLVALLAPAVGDDCVWISEGSNEVGAAAGMTFYLRQHPSMRDKSVLIMSDDPHRPPPHYPGKPPAFLIDRAALTKLWSSRQAALFITDFQRVDWQRDPPHLPLEDCHLVPIPVGGRRRVYANSRACQLLAASGITPNDVTLQH